MKKMISAALTALLTVSLAVSAAAVGVRVTIVDAEGRLAVAGEPFDVSDADGDGVTTINDALICAHDAKYEGGAAAGYEVGETEFGISLYRLWGAEEGTSYGYYLNNASPLSLADPVTDGDRVCAFVYTDTETWSDTFCFFEPDTLTAEEGESVSLTLSAAGFDENWAPITLPVAGAAILVDGTAADAVTDENGAVTLTLPAGSHLISAASASAVLVPPVCLAEVAEAAVTAEVPDDAPAADETPVTAPQTADLLWLAAAAAAVSAVGIVFAKRKAQ